MSERKKSGGASKDKDQKKVKAVKAASDRWAEMTGFVNFWASATRWLAQNSTNFAHNFAKQ